VRSFRAPTQGIGIFIMAKSSTALDVGPLGAPLRCRPASICGSGVEDVGDQVNSGSRVGWASPDEVARYMFVTANRLPQATKLSPRFTWTAYKETDHRPRWCPPETSDEIV
jgi:hypothetical protein